MSRLPGPPEENSPGAAWTFRGLELRPSDFNTAMVHLYRGEVQRSNTWRARLDNTTNWAVITTGAGLSFALSDPGHHHAVVPLNMLLVTLFLWIEARRYRYYELWASRVRLLETDFFAALLAPPHAPRPEWGDTLARSLATPRFPISLAEALGRRCRRNYLALFVVLDLAWALQALIHPATPAAWADFAARFALGPVPGWTVMLGGVAFNAVLVAVAFGTAGLRDSSAELLPEFRPFQVVRRLWFR